MPESSESPAAEQVPKPARKPRRPAKVALSEEVVSLAATIYGRTYTLSAGRTEEWCAQQAIQAAQAFYRQADKAGRAG